LCTKGSWKNWKWELEGLGYRCPFISVMISKEDCRDGLCEQSPELLHVRPEPAPAAPKGTHRWVELSHDQCWPLRIKYLGKGKNAVSEQLEHRSEKM